MDSLPPASSLRIPRTTFRVRVLLAMVRHHWFIRLRWVIAFAVMAVLLVERFLFPTGARPPQVMGCVGALAVANVIWTIMGRGILRNIEGEEDVTEGRERSVERFAALQMTIDLLILTVILRYSGGIENPMAVFYLFHMLIAALLLRPRQALLQGCWAIFLYSVIGFGEVAGWIQPHYPFLTLPETGTAHRNWTLVAAGVVVLAAGVFGTLYFTLQISLRLDQQEREQHQMNLALQHSQNAIRDLQARRSRFMQTAAHQLKSPLTGIEMLARLIRDHVVPPNRIDETVGRIVNRCREAIVQVTELLTLARIQEADPSEHTASTTEIPAVVGEVVKRYGELASARKIQLTVTSAGCRGALAAVAERDLRDCIGNLIDNAIKYTPEGGSVEVRSYCDADTISVSVKDTGMGIAEESADDIFDSFRRGNLALAAGIPGSGLGLAIVREVVEQADGSIEVRSTVGEGSEFIVTFPRHEPERDTARIRATRSARIRPRFVSGNSRADRS
ncbi:MAG: HAMP domain-containing histidine kinase [Phycisphaerae bacterium]|nr:HAMP domain-containing histidine kinase [Phycisphaerae bacterium]